MTRTEFVELRKTQKTISVDIEFRPDKHFEDTWLFAKDIPVENHLGYKVILDGEYNRITKAFGLNFTVVGVGPVCRTEVNGKIHKEAGRTHKHDLRTEKDPKNNLPEAVYRPDLENKKPREVWEIVCQQANIDHTGSFIDP